MPIKVRPATGIDAPSLAARTVTLTLTGAVGFASQAEAEAGTAVDKVMSPLRSKQQIDEEMGPRRPYFIVATGQSNISVNRTLSWTPPSNLSVWNWPSTEAGVGTAFAAPAGTTISWAESLAARFAERNPRLDVYLVRIGFGGLDLTHWTGGFSHTYDSGTGVAPPSGEVRLNNATHSSATAMYVSSFDRDAFNRYGGLFFSGGAARVRIEKESDPTIYREYTPGTLTDNTTYFTVALTYVSGNGTLNDGDAVRVRFGPDVFSTLEANIAPALVEAGADQVDLLLWWQGESDFSPSALYYVNEWEADFFDRGVAAGMWPLDVDVLVSGTVQSNINATLGYDSINRHLQRIVQTDPDNRIYLAPANVFPASYWTDALSVHMTADGYWEYGRMAADAYMAGRGAPAGMVLDPLSRRPLLKDGTFADPSIGFLSDPTTGFFLPTVGKIGLAASGLNIYRYADDTVPPIITVAKSRGSYASPAAVQTSDIVRMDDSSAQASASAAVLCARQQIKVVEGTPGTGAMGVRWEQYLCPTGSPTVTLGLAFDHTFGLMMFNSVIVDANRLIQARSYTVATLPAGAVAKIAYASNLRVFNGAGTQEGAGAGTGGLVTYSSAWKIAGTNVTAVA